MVEGMNFEFTLPVGRTAKEPALNVIIAEYPNGHTEKISVNERYFFQHGQHYMKMQPDEQGNFSGEIKKLGSGIFVNAIIEIPGQPGSAAIGGRFPPSDDLLIM